LSIIGLAPPRTSSIVGGHVLYKGEDLLTKTSAEMREYRGRDISMVLQDPLTALNPVLSIGYQMREVLMRHRGMSRKAAESRYVELLRALRVNEPEARMRNYPHELSGGMRQRVVGAMAMAAGPAVLLADEPTTSLDVTVQAAYLDLLKEIQEETGLAIVFVTHDFGVAVDICDQVAIMYAGRVVEAGTITEVRLHPAHPYTQALLGALPAERGKRLTPIEGQPPSIFALPPGCPFAPRCPQAMDRCRTMFPPETEVHPGHSVSCWLYPQ
jgi:oligopeptide/dipeptide ABC transporter ATP-binding protein